MRYLLTIFSTLILLSCDSIYRDNETLKPIIRIGLLKEYYVPYHGKLNFVPVNDTIIEKRFDISVSIINNSDKMISFWILSCDWERNFLINNFYNAFMGHACDANGPHKVEIKSYDSLMFSTTLVRAIGYDNQCENCIGSYDIGQVETTKLGFIFVDTIKCKGFQDYFNIMRDKSKWDKIIWSNPLYLNK